MTPLRILCVAIIATSLHANSASAVTIADSTADWSTTGTQGENGWEYGRYVPTNDADMVYQTSDFELFTPDWWTGTGWDEPNLDADNVPWTGIGGGQGPDWGHPNSSGDVFELAVRRWTASIAAPMQLEFTSTLAAQNTNGTGSSVLLYQNGNQLDAFATNSAAGVSNTIYANVNPGDIIDFALSSDNLAGDTADGADGSFFTLVVTDNLPPSPPLGDSFDDFTTTGTQGENGWRSGYYNRTLDADGTYQVGDFTEFDASHWTGTQWDLGANAPWTALGQSATHPNGDNNAEIHETIRRFEVSGLSGTTPLALNWTMAKANANGGGVAGALYVNGQLVDGIGIGGADTAGVDRTYYINAQNGDIIDLALTPEDLAGTFGDGSDGSVNRLTIGTLVPDDARQPDTLVVDSAAEFSGNQGQDGWYYGYYDRSADTAAGGDGNYDPATKFTEMTADWWNGTFWDEPNVDGDNVPWTAITPDTMHPNDGDPGPDHYAVRRWVADEDGEFELQGFFENVSANGDGTVGHVYHNGNEIVSILTDGNREDFVESIMVATGDQFDIVVDWGPGADGADNTRYGFNLVIAGDDFNAVPEPSSAMLLLFGVLGLMRFRRR